MKKYCHCCNKETSLNLNDFAENGWSAFSLDNHKAYCFCPECSKKGCCKELMFKKLKLRTIDKAIEGRKNIVL